jgi:heptosyltransferase-2
VRWPNPVGDAVMATPALRALRRAHPAAHITVLGLARHRALLRGLPTFDEFVAIEDKRLRATLARARALRRPGYDWAVLLPDSPRAALEACLARIPRRVGYARDLSRRLLLSDSLDPPHLDGRRVPISMIERYLRITRRLGCPDAGDALELVVDAAAAERVARSLALRGVGADEPLLLVTPGASFGPSKLWPPDHFARAGDEIARRFGLLPIIVPAPVPDEIAIARAVSAHMKERHVNLDEGTGDLAELVALVSRSRLVLTNDTGPRHVAVALDRPAVVLMGPNDPRHTAHLLERQRVLREEVPCSPCQLKVCPIDHRCMTRLSPERAVAAAAELLA